MNFTFTPMTDEELETASLMAEGTYSFQVMKCSKKVSKSGNPMAELMLNVWDNEGKAHTIYDYLVFSEQPFCIRKIKHFCDSTGNLDKYKKGELPEDLTGLCGRAFVVITEATPNGKGGMYAPKNSVDDYVSNAGEKPKAQVKDQGMPPDLNDDIPF